MKKDNPWNYEDVDAFEQLYRLIYRRETSEIYLETVLEQLEKITQLVQLKLERIRK